MGSSVTAAIYIVLVAITNGENITCSGGNCGPCMVNGLCQLNCTGFRQCIDDTLKCKDNDNCKIICDGDDQSEACFSGLVNGTNAIDITMDCIKYQDCVYTEVHSGNGDIIINCGSDGGSSGTNCYGIIVHATHSQNLIINCAEFHACQLMNIYCGNGDCYINCNKGIGSETCVNAHIVCGSGNCVVNCEGVSRCIGITVDTTSASSFECIGDSTECQSAPLSFTSNPTQVPSNVPTTLLPSTFPTESPLSLSPTTSPPTSMVTIQSATSTMLPSDVTPSKSPTDTTIANISHVIGSTEINKPVSNDGDTFDILLIYIIIGCFIATLVVIMIIFCIKRKNKTKNAAKMSTVSSHINAPIKLKSIPKAIEESQSDDIYNDCGTNTTKGNSDLNTVRKDEGEKDSMEFVRNASDYVQNNDNNDIEELFEMETVKTTTKGYHTNQNDV